MIYTGGPWFGPKTEREGFAVEEERTQELAQRQIRRRKKRRQRQALIRLAGLCAAALLALGLLKARNRGTVGGVYPEQVLGVTVPTQQAPEGGPNRPGTKRTIQYIVIHETGNPAAGADAQAHGELQARGGEGTTGWHYTVDDQEIWHSIPDDEKAYHAGDGAEGEGNLHGIGIELCVNQDGDFEKTFDNAARLAGWLMNEYKIPASRVRQHFDFSGKDCPEIIRAQGRMEEFISLAESYARQAAEEDAE